jgi:hypothetical protein
MYSAWGQDALGKDDGGILRVTVNALLVLSEDHLGTEDVEWISNFAVRPGP